MRVPLIAAAAAAVGAAALASSSPATPVKGAPNCPVFPASNPWNQRVDNLPLVGNSTKIVNSIGAGTGLHPDFGSGTYDGGPIGIPFTTVAGSQPKVAVKFTSYGNESDPGPYPVPPGVPIEGGRNSKGDRHALIVDRDNCRLYELYSLYPPSPGHPRWRAASGAIWSLNSNAVRRAGWTSADAAGLPILPGLARYGEVAAHNVNHALRFTVSHTRRAYIYPARHYASDLTSADLPAMGQRLRLKKDYDISHFPPQAREILRALKLYGMIVADNGSDWYITGAPNAGWNNDALHTLGQVKGRAFEVVDTTKLGKPPGG